jgi:hypothetical protein
MPHYYFDIKDGHWPRWICVAAICWASSESGSRRASPDSFISLLARSFEYYVAKYTASAAETWARSKGRNRG